MNPLLKEFISKLTILIDNSEKSLAQPDTYADAYLCEYLDLQTEIRNLIANTVDE